MPSHILIIDDDQDICALLQRFLEKKGFITSVYHKGQRGIAAYKLGTFDAVICDYRLGDMDAIKVINEIRDIDADAAIIVITGYSDTRTAVEVMKLGARDYITKPLVTDELMRAIDNLLPAKESNSEGSGNTAMNTGAGSRGTGKQISTSDIFTRTRSEAMQNVYKLISVVAPTQYSVILYGESGTGKEVAARMIHEQSNYANGPFVAVDCGILSRELAASELFGHVKGAFTGATNDRIGHFAEANGGTLFLDEVANLPADVQTTLLRVIQERKFRPVGSNKEQPANVRIIVASNESLMEANAKGKFREDLYYRFNEFTIHLPPLRHRKEDIIPLAELFMKHAADEIGVTIAGMEKEVKEKLRRYHWPGNLRELKNLMRRAVLLTGRDDIIKLESFPPEFTGNSLMPEEPGNSNKGESGDGIPETGIIEADLNSPATRKSRFDQLKGAAHTAEYNTILQALKEVNFNKKKAAALLKIDRKTLYNKLKNYQMKHSL